MVAPSTLKKLAKEHPDRVRFRQTRRMLIENPPQIRHDFGVPTHHVRVIDLLLHRRKSRHPRDLVVPHSGELIVADEETMFNGIDAAIDHTLYADVA